MKALLLLTDGSFIEMEGTRVLLVPDTLPTQRLLSYVTEHEAEAVPLEAVSQPEDAYDEGHVIIGSHFDLPEVHATVVFTHVEM